jgi:hypothetical protein
MPLFEFIFEINFITTEACRYLMRRRCRHIELFYFASAGSFDMNKPFDIYWLLWIIWDYYTDYCTNNTSRRSLIVLITPWISIPPPLLGLYAHAHTARDVSFNFTKASYFSAFSSLSLNFATFHFFRYFLIRYIVLISFISDVVMLAFLILVHFSPPLALTPEIPLYRACLVKIHLPRSHALEFHRSSCFPKFPGTRAIDISTLVTLFSLRAAPEFSLSSCTIAYQHFSKLLQPMSSKNTRFSHAAFIWRPSTQNWLTFQMFHFAHTSVSDYCRFRDIYWLPIRDIFFCCY